MDNLELAKKLFELGFRVGAAVDTMTPEQLEFLKSMYVAFHGLGSTAEIEAHLSASRYCNLPDVMQAGAAVCKWPSQRVTFSVLKWPQQFTKDQAVKAAKTAMDRWAAVCGIVPEYAPDDVAAMIAITTRSIDGRMGVLAESELPCGNVSQCRQWYDTSESWAIFNGAGGQNQIDLVRVMCHELGHAIGISHIGSGNLMAPIYSQSIWTPQSGDAAEAVARYGPIVTTEPPPVEPPPTEPPPTAEEYTVHVTGKMTVDGYRLTKLV